MRATAKRVSENGTICVSREALPAILGCGQATADKLARAAGARVKVGKRVLVKLDKLNEYLDSVVS